MYAQKKTDIVPFTDGYELYSLYELYEYIYCFFLYLITLVVLYTTSPGLEPTTPDLYILNSTSSFFVY